MKALIFSSVAALAMTAVTPALAGGDSYGARYGEPAYEPTAPYDDQAYEWDDRVYAESDATSESGVYDGTWTGSYVDDQGRVYRGEWEGTYTDEDGRVYEGSYRGTSTGDPRYVSRPVVAGSQYRAAPQTSRQQEYPAGYRDERVYRERRVESRASDYRRTADDYERCRRDNGLGGALIGGVVGGFAGNRIAGRGDRLAGTLIGAGVGAVAGTAIDQAEDRGRMCDAYRPTDYREDNGRDYRDPRGYPADRRGTARPQSYGWQSGYAYAPYGYYSPGYYYPQSSAGTTVVVVSGGSSTTTTTVTEEEYVTAPTKVVHKRQAAKRR